MKIYTAENCGELLKRSNFDDAEAAETVRKIVDDVRRRGDEAIFGYEEKFDGTRLTKDTFRVSEEEFSRSTLGSVISRYFENSYLGAVSALVEEEKISLGELRSLIDRIENQNR